MNGFLERTRPWQSSAGSGPRLRGRRADGRRTVHLLPGNGFCGGVYWPFARHLLDGGYGLFLHDIEGHGESDAPERFSGVGALARRVPAIIGDQGLAGEPLIGMGHSFGAALTLKIAADHPGLFRALVLLDPIALPPPVWIVWRGMGRLGLNPMAKAARGRRTTWPSHDEALSHLRGRGIFKGWTEEALRCFVDHAMKPEGGQWVLRCPPELEAQIYEHPVWCWPSFRRLEIPILFLHGAQSYGFFPASARMARRANRRVDVATVPGDHCFMMENPAEAAAVVRQWLDRALTP